MTDTTQAIDQYLTQHLDPAIAELQRLCAQPSVSARREGIDECAVLVAEILRAHGFAAQVYQTEGHPVVIGTATGASPRTLLFYNHYDVQPPEPLELWTTPPFQPEIRDGKLFARGAKDDKGELLARLLAVDAIRAAHGGELPCGVKFVVEGEEEIGSQHFAAFVRDHLDLLAAEGVVWEEGGTDMQGRPIFWLGPRGLLYVELAVQTLARDAHSGMAHLLPNAAWRLVHALATLKDAEEHVLIPGFYDAVRAITPREHELFTLLYDPEDEAAERRQYGIEQFLNGATGIAAREAVFHPTCNIAGLTSGYQGPGSKTVIPARASAKVDFRLVPNQDPRDILAKLRAHLDQQGFSDVQVTVLGGMGYPYVESVDDPLVQLTLRTAEEVYGAPSKIVPLIGGTTPVYAIAGPLGNIPFVSPGVGHADNRAHSPDEFVRLSDFLNAARHLARVLDGFSAGG